jgi:predicted  nucleic acid-binding Zn-ribbon protein
MENDKEALKKKIAELENELAQLRNLQVALKVILPQIVNYFDVEDESKTILFNLSENDFTSDKKISTFIDFSNKIKTQRDLLVGENAIVDNKRIEVSNQITDFQLKIKKLESNIRQFPSEAEDAKRIIAECISSYKAEIEPKIKAERNARGY